ncbi:MAG: diguanylate cyclase [Cyanobacteria bacterium NC_groundwater_1444_Ag_S-0.65um_54_12]|nr:diguanylate cyclase [Cyanobacteria bacterium NC_groundwater_1444_Ag_S-0.65um_54_12]
MMAKKLTVLVAAPRGSDLMAAFGDDFQVIAAEDSLAALRAATDGIAACIVAVDFPEGGLNVLRALKNRLTPGIPLLLVGGIWEPAWVEAALAAGAVDLITKPAPGELAARTRMALGSSYSERRELLALAYTDELTGLPNRRYLLERLHSAIGIAHMRQEPLSVLLLDIDYFKAINDRFGHRAGDRALIEFAKVLLATSRATDTIGRWGGEEFLYILPGSLETAEVQAERVRVAVAAFPFGAPDLPWRLTVSIGVTELLVTDHSSDLIDRADRLLYHAKKQGRDRTIASCVA